MSIIILYVREWSSVSPWRWSKHFDEEMSYWAKRNVLHEKYIGTLPFVAYKCTFPHIILASQMTSSWVFHMAADATASTDRTIGCQMLEYSIKIWLRPKRCTPNVSLCAECGAGLPMMSKSQCSLAYHVGLVLLYYSSDLIAEMWATLWRHIRVCACYITESTHG